MANVIGHVIEMCDAVLVHLLRVEYQAVVGLAITWFRKIGDELWLVLLVVLELR